MTTKPSPIARRKLSHEVEDRLLGLVQNGGLKPGDRLPSERELMASYRVGRPAIREAMQNMQRMGLIEIRHGDWPRVAEPSMDATVDRLALSMRHVLKHSETGLHHLKEARTTFEAEMARIAARKRTEEDLDRLREILERQRSLMKEPALFQICDGEFHAAIAGLSGNPIFVSLSGALFGWLSEFHADLVRKPGRETLTIDEHQAILDAIVAGDTTLAGLRMADHLNRANVLYHQDNAHGTSG